MRVHSLITWGCTRAHGAAGPWSAAVLMQDAACAPIFKNEELTAIAGHP